MEHLFFIALRAICICFNQIFHIGKRKLTLLLTLHNPLKRTYSLIFLLLFPNTSIHVLYLELLSMDRNTLIFSHGRNGVNTAWTRQVSAINTALNYSFGASPGCTVEFPSLFFTVAVLPVRWDGCPCVVTDNWLQIQDSVQCYCSMLLSSPAFSLLLWAPLPSCCKDFSSQRFSWEVFKLPYWELVNTQHSANVSLCEHVVSMQCICSQRLAMGNKTKTVHSRERKFRNYMLDSCYFSF